MIVGSDGQEHTGGHTPALPPRNRKLVRRLDGTPKREPLVVRTASGAGSLRHLPHVWDFCVRRARCMHA